MTEIRISPDSQDVAIRNRDDHYFPWRVTDGSQRSDKQVADWTVLTTMAGEVAR
jgi:hypothetical protein